MGDVLAARKTILVVEDSATVREQMRGMLAESYDVQVAGDGNAALERIKIAHPSAVIADVNMPGMGGIELLRVLRSTPSTKSLPVIIATTVTAIDTVNECRALGCTGFVLKPVHKEYLLAKLRQLFKD